MVVVVVVCRRSFCGCATTNQTKQVMKVWDQFFRNALMGFDAPPGGEADDDYYAPHYWSDDGRTR